MSLDAKIGLDNLSRNEDRPRYRVGSPSRCCGSGTGQARFGRTGVSGSVARVSRMGLRYTPRRTGGAALAVVRLRQHEHQRPTLVLLASRRKPEEHENGSVSKAAADASKPEAFLAGVEIVKVSTTNRKISRSLRKDCKEASR